MIKNEKQYFITLREATKFEQAARAALAMPAGDVSPVDFVIAEAHVRALQEQARDLRSQLSDYDARTNADRRRPRHEQGDVMDNPRLRLPWKGDVPLPGAVLQFPGVRAELVKLCENDFDYVYQGAVVRANGGLFHAEFWGPFAYVGGPLDEEIVLRLDQPVVVRDGLYYVDGETFPLGGAGKDMDVSDTLGV